MVHIVLHVHVTMQRNERDLDVSKFKAPLLNNFHFNPMSLAVFVDPSKVFCVRVKGMPFLVTSCKRFCKHLGC